MRIRVKSGQQVRVGMEAVYGDSVSLSLGRFAPRASQQPCSPMCALPPIKAQHRIVRRLKCVF
jgi:hypothetical protein